MLVFSYAKSSWHKMPILVYYFIVYLYYCNRFQQVKLKILTTSYLYGYSKKVPKINIPEKS